MLGVVVANLSCCVAKNLKLFNDGVKRGKLKEYENGHMKQWINKLEVRTRVL